MGGGARGIGGQGWVRVGVGSWGPNTGCKALAKSNMVLFVFAGRGPRCVCLPSVPSRSSSTLGLKIAQCNSISLLRGVLCWGLMHRGLGEVPRCSHVKQRERRS